MPTALGLRIDADTFRGTRDGVPRLLDILGAHGVTATFFFSLGPDNMGRHLRRLIKPRFLGKMIRSQAASLYGWDILLAGTFWPGRRIGRALRSVLRAIEVAGHEVGLHAWDHHRWQVAAGRMTVAEAEAETARGIRAFEDVFGRRPDCSAAAGWICTERVLEAKEALGFRYNSDCRGRSIFVPVANGRRFAPQVPTTLPTYDEVMGRDGTTNENYNERLIDRILPDRLNVLAVHAEVEGIVCSELFDAFLTACAARGVRPVPLRSILDAGVPPTQDTLAQAPIPGREGDVCWQRSALGH